MKALMHYSTNIENCSNKEKASREQALETRSRLQKLQIQSKAALKNSTLATSLLKRKKAELASTGSRSSLEGGDPAKSSRVRDVLGALRKVAEKRREQLNQKRSSTFSSAWVQSFPGLPSALKKSLWHKMHRRKHQGVLRPTAEAMITELRSFVQDSLKPASGESDGKVDMEAELQRAEQLFLIATHPLDEDCPIVPPTKSTTEDWGEPGWKINLSVPDNDDPDALLPVAPSFPVLERNLAEFASAPGRQASSLLRASHMSCLTHPLSSASTVSSPAESSTMLTKVGTWMNAHCWPRVATSASNSSTCSCSRTGRSVPSQLVRARCFVCVPSEEPVQDPCAIAAAKEATAQGGNIRSGACCCGSEVFVRDRGNWCLGRGCHVGAVE